MSGCSGKKPEVRRFLGRILIFIGLLIFLLPTLRSRRAEYQNQRLWRVWEKQNLVTEENEDRIGRRKDEKSNSGDRNFERERQEGTNAEDTMASWTNREEIQAYNEELVRNRQIHFNNEAIVEQIPEVLKDMENMVFGFIEVPKMQVILPIYLGASEEHLTMGAAVLGETSIPIGGVSANSVIAGHRGYQGIPYFRQIEDLAVGDSVYITNTWERMHYLVTEIRILEPTDSDVLRIQEGKDMVTLLTCHPYRSRGRQRYAVFCERDPEEVRADRMNGSVSDDENTRRKTAAEQEDDCAASGFDDGSEEGMVSSQEDLRREDLLRRAGACVIALCLIGAWQSCRRRRG